MKKVTTYTAAIAALVLATAFITRRPATGRLTLAFQHYAGSSPLQLDTVSYTNELGQPFTITMFKYYIGKVQLQRQAGTALSLPDYYLINEDDELSKQVVLSDIPAGQYTGISFLVGVDSADNCSGAQAGALDPVNAMFWAWNTGYIFLKLEGKAPASTLPGHILEYHIGGYKPPASCIRRISLAFATPLTIASSGDHRIAIKADATELLKTPSTISFAELPSVTDLRHATTIANNYTDMFSLLSVQ